jgi:non-ribosomal peptide synthetase component F
VALHRLALERSLAERLREIGRGERATFYITMLAATSTLLYRLSGEEDVVIGSPIANRNLAELEGLIGFFTNTIALRTRLRGNPSFREVIRRAREAALGAYAHQDLPFERVVELVAPKRDPSHNPLFVVNFRAQEAQRPALVLEGLETETIAVDVGFSRFDLALEFELRPDALAGFFEYDRDLFNPDSVAGFALDLEALLAQVADDPDAPVLELRLPRGAGASGPASGARIARRSSSRRPAAD